MNIFNILSDIEKIDGDAAEKFNHSRRKMLKTTSVAAATSSLFFAGVLNKAYGQSNTITDVLNFALVLEYLEAEFYMKGMQSSLNFGPDRGLINEIAKHEAQHVAFLKSALGASAVAKPEFDFTAKGAFPNPYTNYPVFLTLAQAFEDTGVRAYKGQAPNLASNRDILEAALRIHSVEARHAGEIRIIRNMSAYASEMKTGGVPAAIYARENNTTHVAGVDIVALSQPKLLFQNNASQMRAMQFAQDSFDEPLTKEEVLAIAGPFIK